MSATETSAPQQKIAIAVDPSPPPPWAGVKFTCEKCGAIFQLQAADKCAVIDPAAAAYFMPACWDCGHVNVVTIAADAAATAGGKTS
jgi:hypothetical protein